MKKNVLSRILIACLALVMLFGMVGCVSNTPTDPVKNPSSETKDPTKETEDPLQGHEPVKLTFWVQSMIGAGDMTLPEEERYINQCVARFEEKYPWIEIDIVKTEGGAESQAMFKSASLAGTAPDIAEFSTGGGFNALADYALSIYDYLSEETKQNIGMWELVTVDGKNIGVPVPFGTMAGLYYNKAIIKEAGLDFENNPPRTIEEFFDACEKIKAAGYTPIINDEGGVNYLWHYVGKFWMCQAMTQEEQESASYAKTKYADNEKFLQAMDYYQQLYTKGYVISDTLTASDWQERWLAGDEAAMNASASHMAAIYTEGLGDDLGFIQVPNIFPEAECNNYNASFGGAGQGFMVSKDTKHPEEVALFLDFICSPEEWLEYYNAKQNCIPNVAGVDTSKMKQDYPVMAKLASLQEYKVGYCSWTRSGLSWTRYSDDLLTGKMTPAEFAKALDDEAATLAVGD